jgi:hypothetical protein
MLVVAWRNSFMVKKTIPGCEVALFFAQGPIVIRSSSELSDLFVERG